MASHTRAQKPFPAFLLLVLALALLDAALAVFALRTRWYASSPFSTFAISLYGALSGIVVAIYGAVRLLTAILLRVRKSPRRLEEEEIVAAVLVAAWNYMQRPFFRIAEVAVLAALGGYLVTVLVGTTPLSVGSPVLAFKWGTDTRIYVADQAHGGVLPVRASISNIRDKQDVPIGRSGTGITIERPSSMVLDPAALDTGSKRPYLYVADSAQGKIEVIDLNTDTVLDRYIPAGKTPRAVAITPDGKKMFVSNEQPIPTGSITVVDVGDAPGSARIIDDIRAVACPQGLAISRDGTKLYVASQCGAGDDPVFVLDTRSHRVVSTIRGLAVGVALDPDDETLYVARGNAPCVKPGGGPGSPFSVVDLKAKAIGPTICLDTSVSYIAVSLDGDFVFVANGPAISIFDGKQLRAAKGLRGPEREAAGEAALVHTARLEGAIGGIGVAMDNRVYAWIPSTPRLFLFSPGKSN
jgi:DNA-binding beta-propeller fold protein YncE